MKTSRIVPNSSRSTAQQKTRSKRASLAPRQSCSLNSLDCFNVQFPINIPTVYVLYVIFMFNSQHFQDFIGETGDFFIPAFACPHRVRRVGTLGDGGKWVCGLERIAEQPSCVIYSVGAPLMSRASLCDGLAECSNDNNNNDQKASTASRRSRRTC
jgi:hypothetical protein